MTTNNDIWLITRLPLSSVCELLELEDACFDGEDYWEWAIGNFDNIRIDITRTHTIPADKTETRVFRMDRKPFSADQIQSLSCRLVEIAIDSTVCWGAWVYRGGQKFEFFENGRHVFSRQL